MTYTKTKITAAALGLMFSVGIVQASPLPFFASNTNVPGVAPKHDRASRIAARLQSRIERRFGRTVPLYVLRDAVTKRMEKFAMNISVALQDQETGELASTWTVSLGRYPEWMTFKVSDNFADFDIDRSAIDATLTTSAPDGLTVGSFAVVTGVTNDGKVDRAAIDGVAQDGHVYDSEQLADQIEDAFRNGHETIIADVKSIKGALLYNDGQKTLVLHEMGVGRSEFQTSPWGRKQNVRKAMNEKANGIVIPAGSTFSYNSTLGGAISHSNGWYDSLIIVNGRDLEPAPGGGICQSATTVYRAAMAAGVPIKTRKSHSLYVTYYKSYGVGMDATVFPGKQDLTFENDTSGPMILVGKTDEHDNAYSILYGVDDRREVELDGPYFGYVHKEAVMGRFLRSNEVAWIQRVTKPDGSVREQLQVAQYSGLPKSVALEFQPSVHGSADLVADAVIE